MILVDTSVWIDYLSGKATDGTRKLEEIWLLGVPVAITPMVVQELLQGTSGLGDFDRLESYLATQLLLQPADSFTSWAGAARLYQVCRRKGMTVRSSNDCVVAQVAIEHDLPLLHSDADFDAIAQVAPLRIY